MAEITLKYAEGYEVCCPLCGTPESQSPVRCPDAQKPGERWITCSKCGTSYKPPMWHAAGGGAKGNLEFIKPDGERYRYSIPTWPPGDGGPGYRGHELEIDAFYGGGGGDAKG